MRDQEGLRFWLGCQWLNFKWGMVKWREALIIFTVWHLPHWIVYWSVVRAGTKTIKGDEVVSEVPFTTVLRRFGRGYDE